MIHIKMWIKEEKRFEDLLMNIHGKWHCIEQEKTNSSMERNQC